MSPSPFTPGRRVLLAALATACATSVPTAAQAAAEPVYALAGGCYALQDTDSGRFVVRKSSNYELVPQRAADSEPFRLQATALGRYLLYGSGGRMPQTASPITWRQTPTSAADWTITQDGGELRITSLSSGKNISVDGSDRLTATSTVARRWAFKPIKGCDDFPELETGATGTPLTGSATGQARGFLDTHTHVSAYQFLGGKFHCGKPWSPYGVTEALRDCADHGPNGSTALVENLISHGDLGARHASTGWPSFQGWPTHDSQTHESTYWKWIERAWRGGLRVMVNDVVENRALCELYPLKQNPCNDMKSAELQVRSMHELQDYIDAQSGGPGKGFFRLVTSPEQARQVIASGKLAVVLGIEVSEILDCKLSNGTPTCTKAQIDQRLTALHGLGVQSAFVAHKFDNGLAGTTYDNDATGVFVNIGNLYATGRWWDAQKCEPGQEADHTPPGITGQDAAFFSALSSGFGGLLVGKRLPVYPPGALCNPRGLSDLGAHMVRKMADLGMIVEADHMSVKARNATLDLLQSIRYPGVISSHSWSDEKAQARVQQLGGLVSSYGNGSEQYVENWQRIKSTRGPGLYGIGYGSDSNGLGAQPGPRAGAMTDRPVLYPYKSFDGGTTLDRQPAGTRTFDVNTDGVANYGLFPDWIQDMRNLAGPEIVDDMANGAEAYLQLWERARGWQTP